MCAACNPMCLGVLAHVAHAEDEGLGGRAVPLEQVDHARRHDALVDVLMAGLDVALARAHDHGKGGEHAAQRVL